MYKYNTENAMFIGMPENCPLSCFLTHYETFYIFNENIKVKNSLYYSMVQYLLLYRAGLMHNTYIAVFNMPLVILNILSTYRCIFLE